MANRTQLTLRYYGDPILRQKAAPVSSPPGETRKLVEEMFECLYREAGVGLAAPQVGLSQRLFILDVPEDDGGRVKRAFVNPVIVERSGSMVGEEGCLSIPGLRSDVKRAARVVVEAADENGAPFRLQAEGLLSRAIQHETDHLDGILFVDRLGAIQRKLMEGKLKKFRPPAGSAGESSRLKSSL